MKIQTMMAGRRGGFGSFEELCRDKADWTIGELEKIRKLRLSGGISDADFSKRFENAKGLALRVRLFEALGRRKYSKLTMHERDVAENQLELTDRIARLRRTRPT